jgi:RNA polymerase sigma-70 factor (sigma-E family)
VTGEDDFIAYAQARAQRLQQRAYLLCHDWHLAQDLTQITLARLYASWRRVQNAESVDGYATKIMIRAFLDHKRLKSSREIVTDQVPERAGQSGAELRLTLLEALRLLPPRERAIVVLRYWEDHSVATVAEMLSVSPGVVKQRSMRALTQLRAVLGPDVAALTE